MKILEATAALALLATQPTCGEEQKVERMSEQIAHEAINVIASFKFPPDCKELAEKSVDALDEFDLEAVAPNSAVLKDGGQITITSTRIAPHIRSVMLEIEDQVKGGFNGIVASFCKDE